MRRALLTNHLTHLLMLLLWGGSIGGGAWAQSGLDPLHQKRYAQDSVYRQRIDRMNAYILRTSPQVAETATRAEVLTVPVVIHIMHDPADGTPKVGTSNPTDAQIQAGLRQLNEAFRNQGIFAGGPFYSSAADSAPSVDTHIEFVLAKSDTNGLPTRAINRVPTPLTRVVLEDSCSDGRHTSQEVCLKTESIWNPEHYLNIWLVEDLCLSAGYCDARGHAWLPGAHGKVEDGIVIESGFWGHSDDQLGAVAAYYAGRYLGLLPTFNLSRFDSLECQNNDCRINGDLVCDTPPDATVGGASCGERLNSCSTDPLGFPLDPSNPNSPLRTYFPQDVEDMYENFMDGDAPDCKRVFTAGQMVRMRSALNQPSTPAEPTRNLLLTSPGLEENTYDLALEPRGGVGVLCDGRNYTPSFWLINEGTQPITRLRLEARLGNGAFLQEDWQGNLAPGARELFTMARSLRVEGTMGLIRVRAVTVEGRPGDRNPSNSRFWQPLAIPGAGFAVSPQGYRRDFNDGPPSDWKIGQLDSASVFAMQTRADCNTSEDLMLQHRRRQGGQMVDSFLYRDFLIGPNFDLSGYGRARLRFKVAYHQQRQLRNPTVRIHAVVCGEESTLLFESNAADLAATDSLLPPEYRGDWRPATCDDWMPMQVDLSAYSGQRVRLLIEVMTDSTASPALYLDDLRLEAEVACEPPARILASPGTVVQADQACFGQGGWIHYVKTQDENTPQDLLLLSIKKPSGATLDLDPQEVSMMLTDGYGQGGHDLSDSAGYADNFLGWHTTGRYVRLARPLQVDQPLLVRTYFDQQDLADLWEAVPALAGTDHLLVYHLDGQSEGDPRDLHRSVAAGDYREFFPADSLAPQRWVSSTHGNYYGATFQTKELRVIGTGSGGDGQGLGAQYPVAFDPFTVEQVRSKVYLSGTLARERGTLAIEVYRAREERPGTLTPGAFELMETLPARGDDEAPLAYSWVDDKPLESTAFYFYRLTHASGYSYTSDTLRLTFDPGKLVTVYPNPTEGLTQVRIDARSNVPVRMNILDANRRTLLSYDWIHSDVPETVDLSTLPIGLYFYQVIYQGQAYWGKVIRQD